jgi:dimethylhistidine N-methyltransferase
MRSLNTIDNLCAKQRAKNFEASSMSPENDFLRDVIEGLNAPQKFIPGKYLWDENGSSIFDQICRSNAYYPTRCELTLLNQAVEEIAQILGPKSCLVEIGSGASHKIRIFLNTLETPKRYVPIDISREFLTIAAQRIQVNYPALEVMDVCADYSIPLPKLPIDRTGDVLALFLGTSISNVDRESAKGLLSRLREVLAPSWLLIGQDPNRDPKMLAGAYGGSLMAAFHKNIFMRMIRELSAYVVVDHFEHEPRFFDNPARTEPHLVARRPTAIIIDDREIPIAAGESIRTDVSWKYSKPDFLTLVAEAGWAPIRSWVDDDGLYGLHLLRSRT